jgi:hypothetical protein
MILDLLLKTLKIKLEYNSRYIDFDFVPYFSFMRGLNPFLLT